VRRFDPRQEWGHGRGEGIEVCFSQDAEVLLQFFARQRIGSSGAPGGKGSGMRSRRSLFNKGPQFTSEVSLWTVHEDLNVRISYRDLGIMLLKA
jgi:hypothetical protein